MSLLQDNRFVSSPPQQSRFRTQSDNIRRQHDSGKKRKATQAPNVITNKKQNESKHYNK